MYPLSFFNLNHLQLKPVQNWCIYQVAFEVYFLNMEEDLTLN
ncbi:hypothetical protein J564_0992 [Acinetobacter baumannii 1525283]|nr:hypothetical protein J498_0864 [Acinetobacter baumannii 781407]EXE31404.1 hypothetical protein J564_0992 [Acinetobacter baumannii 1525283]QCR58556.1 hypothetical protein D1G37_03543 [Acinetobacter baumannii]